MGKYHNVKTDYSDSYVSLFLVYDPERRKKIISCMFCKNFLYVETGKVVAVIEGEFYDGVSKILKCQVCKTRWILNQKIEVSQVV